MVLRIQAAQELKMTMSFKQHMQSYENGSEFV